MHERLECVTKTEFVKEAAQSWNHVQTLQTVRNTKRKGETLRNTTVAHLINTYAPYTVNTISRCKEDSFQNKDKDK